MIALAILGMGLLVIGAALPLGVRFTRESIDRDTGAAATDYALSVLQRSLGVSDRIFDPNDPTPSSTDLYRAPPLFVPRNPWTSGDPNSGRFDPVYVPHVKVRPVLTQNIAMSSVAPADTEYNTLRNAWLPGGEIQFGYGIDIPLVTEKLIGNWIKTALGSDALSVSPREVAQPYRDPVFPFRWALPAISSGEIAYPPVVPSAPTAPELFVSNVWSMYSATAGPAGVPPSDATKIMSQRISWVTFARRVSYAPGSDPYLYEMITVAARRPSERHRYPVQGWIPAIQGYPPSGGYYAGIDSVAPIPWLVAFSNDPSAWPSLPLLEPGIDYDNALPSRALREAGQQKVASAATLRFVAERTVGNLMPAGSILIPAVLDDDDPATITGGFVPACKDILPIYEVVQRIWNAESGANGHYEIIVKSNGYYPWVGDTPTANSSPLFPVWVIPPAFEEYEPDGAYQVPVFPDQSPVVAISRRFIRLQEVP